nr:hypothetical protein [candidate division Zixibacteria bacterium]
MIDIKRSLFPAFLMLMFLVSGLHAADINNPVPCYRLMDGSPDGGFRDSILIGTISFDPLPAYNQETRVIIEHYAQFDSETGLAFKYNRRFDGSVELDNYGKTINEPVKAGDTVAIEFTIKPMKIGWIPVDFIVYENCFLKEALESGRSVKTGGSFKADLLISPEGTISGLASDICTSKNASALGPSANQLDKEIIFQSDPRICQPEFYPSLCRRINEKLYKHIFSIKTVIRPDIANDHGYIIDCFVQPYHSFTEGIAVKINYSDNMEIPECPASLNYPVDSNSIYQFSIPVRLVKPGIGRLTIGFITPNPDKGQAYGMFAHRKGDLNSKQAVYFGIDDNLEVSFITEHDSYTTYRQLQKDESAGFIDPRYQLPESNSSKPSRITLLGESYRTIMDPQH